jgi:hypothetical protein
MPNIIRSTGSIAQVVNQNTGSDSSVFTGLSFPIFNPVLRTVNGVVRGAACPEFGVIKLSDISLALNKLNAFGVDGLACPASPIITEDYRDLIVGLAFGDLDTPTLNLGNSFSIEGVVNAGFVFYTYSPSELGASIIQGPQDRWRFFDSGNNVIATFFQHSPPDPTPFIGILDGISAQPRFTVRQKEVTKNTPYRLDVELPNQLTLITTYVRPGLGLPADVPVLSADFQYPPGTTSSVDPDFGLASFSVTRESEVAEVHIGFGVDFYINNWPTISTNDFWDTGNPTDFSVWGPVDPSLFTNPLSDPDSIVSTSSSGGEPDPENVNVSYSATVPKIVCLDGTALAFVGGTAYGFLAQLIAPFNCN